MEVIRHDYISNDFAGPLLPQSRADFKEGKTTLLLSKDRHSIDDFASDEMKSTRKIEVGPLASHEVVRDSENFCKQITLL